MIDGAQIPSSAFCCGSEDEKLAVTTSGDVISGELVLVSCNY
jgi:hypothetical protein